MPKKAEEAEVKLIQLTIWFGDMNRIMIRAYEGPRATEFTLCEHEDELPDKGKLYKAQGKGDKGIDLLNQVLQKIGEGYPEGASITLKVDDDTIVPDAASRGSRKP